MSAAERLEPTAAEWRATRMLASLYAAAPVLRPVGEPRCVGHRVDWLQLAFKVELSEHALATVVARGDVANVEGRAAIELGGDERPEFIAQLARTRSPDRFVWENGDARGLIDLHATAGWTVEVIFHATYLATHSLEATLERAARIAAAFGEVFAARVRRADLSADFVGWPLVPEDWDSLVKARRGKIGDWKPDREKELAGGKDSIVRYHTGAKVTGFTVCPGNVLMGRIYDKVAELAHGADETKHAIETERWAKHGRMDDEGVTRVEFQLRGVALDELEGANDAERFDPAARGVRDPRVLAKSLDAIWQYATREWLRLVVVGTDSRKHRCDVDPRWACAQAVRFTHDDVPSVRRRKRGGASSRQALGCTLSALASVGKLVPLEVAAETENLLVNGWTESEASRFVLSHVTSVAASFARLCTDDLLREGPHEAAASLLTRVNATVARFVSSDDPPLVAIEPLAPAPWKLTPAAATYDADERACLVTPQGGDYQTGPPALAPPA